MPIHKDLVEILPSTHNVMLELAYATPNNVTGKPLYQKSACYLHKTAEERLKKAISLAAVMGLRFKIFDAFRPLETQYALWNHFQDPNYISHPEKGSIPHCRGVAVDLTLIRADGTELDMGTAFDHFGSESHLTYTDLPTDILTNRMILLGLMTNAGWDHYVNEWWHYQLHDARSYHAFTDRDAGTTLL